MRVIYQGNIEKFVSKLSLLSREEGIMYPTYVDGNELRIKVGGRERKEDTYFVADISQSTSYLFLEGKYECRSENGKRKFGIFYRLLYSIVLPGLFFIFGVALFLSRFPIHVQGRFLRYAIVVSLISTIALIAKSVFAGVTRQDKKRFESLLKNRMKCIIEKK